MQFFLSFSTAFFKKRYFCIRFFLFVYRFCRFIYETRRELHCIFKVKVNKLSLLHNPWPNKKPFQTGNLCAFFRFCMQIFFSFCKFLIYGLILCSIMKFINFLRIILLSVTTTDKCSLLRFLLQNGFVNSISVSLLLRRVE